MKKDKHFLQAAALLCVFAISAAGCAPSLSPQNTLSASLSVSGQAETQDKRTEISDLLFGVFLEDINYASFALDCDLIADGLFEYDLSDHWQAGKGASLTATDGINGTGARLSLVGTGAELRNTGYSPCPMAVEEGILYRFSAFVRADGYTGKITLRLQSEEMIYAQTHIDVSQSGEWLKYTAEMTAQESAAEGVFFSIIFEEEGELCLDGVSLQTSDNTAGIKNYLYNAIADLSPRFIRFPGGCAVEGKDMESAYDWKHSIGVDENGKATVLTYTAVAQDGTRTEMTTKGERVTRTPNTDLWQPEGEFYQMQYGVGFYEYFLLCESVGASAIPIVNCGITCFFHGGAADLPGRNGNGAQDYIQDALDLVAFALGDPSSEDKNEAYWASVRVDMGHEEPFDMRYIGIGNEQWGRYYDRYELFLEAFRQAAEQNPLYAQVQLIVGNGYSIRDTETDGKGGLAREEAISYRNTGKIETLSEYGVQDHHCYMNYTDFFTHADHYDSYSRDEQTRYDVFVGEFSANQKNDLNYAEFNTADNSWISALSEAAYMTGLERNGDVVKLAAYAPMFGCADGSLNQWAVNMMSFDNTRFLPSANYYVQQLFMKNQGSRLLESTCSFANESDSFCSFYGTRTETSADRLYYVTSLDEKTGDVLIKLVNAGKENISLAVTVSDAKLGQTATQTTLQADDPESINTFDNLAVSPQTKKISAANSFEILLKGYSVNVLRIPCAH